MDRDKQFNKTLARYRDQLAELFQLIKEEDKARVRRWEDEKPSLETLLKSLGQTCEILVKEKKRIAADLTAAQVKAPAPSAPSKAQAHRGADDAAARQRDVLDLQRQLVDLNNKVQDIDLQLKTANEELATCDRVDEREYLSTKLVVLQDTRRILLDEVATLRSDLSRIDATVRVEAERRRAEESGWAAVGRLDEQLAKATARMDRVKQQLYFPEAKGYRFSSGNSGNSGIYVAAKDLYLSEISGRFEFSCEPVPGPHRGAHGHHGHHHGGHGQQRGQAQAQAPPPPPPRAARLRVVLGGVSSTADWSEMKHSSKVSAHAAESAARSGPRPPRTASGLSVASNGGANTSSGAAAGPAAAGQPPARPASAQSTTRSSGGGASGSGSAGGSPVHASPPYAPPKGTAGSVNQPASPQLPAAVTSVGAISAGSLSSFSSAPAGDPSGTPAARSAAPRPSSGHHSHPLATAAGGRPSAGGAQAGAGASPRSSPVGGAGAAGGTVGLPYQHGALNPPPLRGSGGGSGNSSKGEAVSNFLSGLKQKKQKLQNIISGPGAGTGGGGGVGAGVGDAGGGPDDSPDRSGVGSRIAARGALVLDKMHDGLVDSKGRLSRMAKNIASKAPKDMQALRAVSTSIKTKLQGAAAGGRGPAGATAGTAYHGDDLAAILADAEAAAAGTPPGAPGDGSSGPAIGNLLDLDPDYFGSGVAGPGTGSGPGAAGAAKQQEQEPDLARNSGSSVASASNSQAAGGSEAAAGGPAGLHTTASSKSIGGCSDDADDLLDSGFLEDFECRPSRKGVYVQLLGEQVELVGERGTKVPDTSIREIMLEVEVAVTAVLEYHPAGSAAAAAAAAAASAAGASAGPVPGSAGIGGWMAPEPVSFQILQLHHRMRGNTIPLPKALLKGLLNAYMPGVLTRVLLALLPAELGAYTLACGEGQALSGEFKVAGPSLPTLVVSVAPPDKPPSSDPAKRAKWAAAQAAAGRARSMLGLSDPQAAALAELFGGASCRGPGLVPDSAGLSSSISGLCKLYVRYGQSGLWPALLGVMEQALAASFEYYSVPQADRFSLARFLEGSVARMVRKPLRIAFAIERLQLALDCDAGLATLRDYFERLAREYSKKAEAGGGGGAAGARGDAPARPPAEPLEVQLELLDLWHAGLARLLRTFKGRFRSAVCTVMLSADRDEFQVGAENVSYDGPLKLKVPLDLVMDPDGSFLIDVKLPDREQASNSLTSLLTEIMYSLSSTVGGGTGGDGAGAQAAAGAAAAAVAGAGARAGGSAGGAVVVPVAAASPLADIGSEWAAALAEAMPEGGALGAAPLLQNPVVGQVSVRKLALTLRLDEERVADLLTGAANAAAAHAHAHAHGAASSAAAATPASLPSHSGSFRLPHQASTSSSGVAAPGPPLPAGSSVPASGSGSSGAELVGRLLGCYGDLFVASVDVGWRPEADADDAPQRPCCMLKVESNEVTRLRADVAGLWFQSSVSPRLAVRVLQAVVIAIILKFHSADSYSIRFWNRAFNQLHEYLSRGSLDMMLCLSLRATTDRQRDRLVVELAGHQDPRAAQAGGAAAGGSGGPDGLPSSSGPVCPVYLINDVNLMTVLDSAKLLAESAAQ